MTQRTLSNPDFGLIKILLSILKISLINFITQCTITIENLEKHICKYLKDKKKPP